MYVEERMHLLHPGKAPEYFKHYEEVGMKVQLKHLPNLVGCAPFFVERLKKMLAAVK
jgi:hypothetical protein